MQKRPTIDSTKVLDTTTARVTGGVTLASHKEDKKVLVGMKKIGASEEQNQWIAYAFKRCGEECVRTWEAESGWRLDAVSRPNKDGTKDYGLCQFNSRYHKNFIASPSMQNPYAVLDYCIGIWEDAIKKKRIRTTFYAYNVRNSHGVTKRFEFIYQ